MTGPGEGADGLQSSILEGFDIKVRAQLVKDTFIRLATILTIHCEGPIYVFFTDIDENYIRLYTSLHCLLETEGLEHLRDIFLSDIPDSLHSLGEDADAFDEWLQPELNRLKGEVLKYCVRIGAGYEEVTRKIFEDMFKNYDNVIGIFNMQKQAATNEWMQEHGFGQVRASVDAYVSTERINELKRISSPNFDLAKLVRLCEELNIVAANDCYYAAGMLLRTITDHVPPVFGYTDFAHVASEYGEGGASFKNSVKRLYESLRQIANSYLHMPIRKKEVLPNRIQVNFSSDLDVLLAEIVRRLK